MTLINKHTHRQKIGKLRCEEGFEDNQRGNQNSYIDEEQITQWPKEKVQRTNNDLQNIHIKLKIE
jgi:hypothetical protein